MVFGGGTIPKERIGLLVLLLLLVSLSGLNKMYAHKLEVYYDDPHKKVVFCSVCGQDSDLSKSCPGRYELSPKDDAAFMRIFGAPVLKPNKKPKFVSGLA